jgi:hypothetical protein
VKNRFQNLPFKCNLQRYTEELQQLAAENDEKEAACIAALGAALDGNAGGWGWDLRAARTAAVKLTYLARIRKEIKERL